MAPLNDYLQRMLDAENRMLLEKDKDRHKELSGLQASQFDRRYAIQVIIAFPEKATFLLEHEKYKQLKHSTDLYYRHPADSHIPVEAHYHIVSKKTG